MTRGLIARGKPGRPPRRYKREWAERPVAGARKPWEAEVMESRAVSETPKTSPKEEEGNKAVRRT